VARPTRGIIDVFDWVDGLRGIIPHVGWPRVPQGAPLAVAGWAIDPTSPIPPRAVAIVLDRERTYPAEAFLDRSDVQSELGPQTPDNIGFRGLIRIDGLPPGGHELRAYALGADDAWYEAAYQPFWVYASAWPELGIGAGRVRFSIDATIDAPVRAPRGASVGIVPFGHFAVVTGWAIDLARNTAPAGVCAVDQHGSCWSAPCDLPRPDVQAVTGARTDRLGFELHVPSDELGRGHHELSVYAFDANGRRFGSAEEVEVQVAAEMRPFPGFARPTADEVGAAAMIVGGRRPIVLEPSRVVECERGEALQIEGWAVAEGSGRPAPAALVFLELRVPGVQMPPLRYQPVSGFRRQLTTRDIPKPPRADAWFSYRLDTSDLAPRTYALRVVVVAANRWSYACGELGSIRIVPSS
jgi:hypothetical protein